MTCCLLLQGICAVGQTPPELKAFEDAVGNGSVLFRGKQATAYERRANGNPYWSSNDFVPGEIVFEGIFYDNILINIDAVAEEVLVRKAENPIAIALSPEKVSVVTTRDSRFESVRDDVENIPKGLYEVFGNGREKIYKHVSKRLMNSSQYMNGAPIGYNDPAYRSDLSDYYAINKVYYFQDSEGRFSRIRGKRALLRKFPERRSEIRKALSASKLDLPGVDFDAYCMEVLNVAAR